MWGTSLRQRLRLMPLYLALVAADGLRRMVPDRNPRTFAPFRKGVSIVIPDRDAPELLLIALESVGAATSALDEPYQIIVVANGAGRERYAAVLARYPQVELTHRAAPLGFSAAIALGLRQARYDWTYLMNNDVVLDSAALAEVLNGRANDVFAIGSRISQKSADGRQEETGFTDWHLERGRIALFHAQPGEDPSLRAQVCASGGAALFRSDVLRRYLRASTCFDPFYWEDVEWGVRAWREGLRVLFCPRSHVLHRHRTTVRRFYDEHAIDRIVERNRLLFDARHAVSGRSALAIIEEICALSYEGQREFARPQIAAGVLRRRLESARRPQPLPPRAIFEERPVIDIPPASYCYRLRAHCSQARDRPRVLMVTPFAVFPPRHGGARRVSELIRELRRHYDLILLSDEASQYDVRSLPQFDGLHAVHLVQRRDRATSVETELEARIESHCHDTLRAAVSDALGRYRPDLVQIEHVELSGLIECRQGDTPWVLTLHDACGATDFHDPELGRRFQERILNAYDAIVVCSTEDRSLIEHRHTVCVPNGARTNGRRYVASQSTRLLFMGPFRYAQNREGIRTFLERAYPAVKASVPDANVLVLGGDEAAHLIESDPVFAQPGVVVMGHREDVPDLLAESALTINPLTQIRGSAVKLIESLMAGRACVSTVDGARGFNGIDLPGLVCVPSVEDMAGPIVALLREETERHRLEMPVAEKLAPFRWERSAALQRELYQDLLAKRV